MLLVNLLDPPKLCWGCCLAARAEKARGATAWPPIDRARARRLALGVAHDRRIAEADILRLRATSPAAHGMALHEAFAAACLSGRREQRDSIGWRLSANGHAETWPGRRPRYEPEVPGGATT